MEASARLGGLEAAVVATLTAAGFAYDAARDAFTAADEGAVRFWRAGAAALRDRNDPAISVMIPASLGGVTVREAVTARLRLSRFSRADAPPRRKFSRSSKFGRLVAIHQGFPRKSCSSQKRQTHRWKARPRR